MRFLVIAVLSISAWFGPVSASAIQVQSPLTVTAVSMWAKPAVPGTQLNPLDPQVLRLTSSIMSFSVISAGNTVMPEDLDAYFTDTIEAYVADNSNGTVQEVVVPQYGQESRAASIVFEGLLVEVIASYDDQFLYLLMAVAEENSPSALPMLSGIADQMFAPARPDQSTGAIRVFLEGFAPEVGGGYESLLIRLPQRAEVPAEYQLLDEEVILT